MTESNPREQGNYAEEQACRFLLGRGLQLVSRNFRCHRGEIDLVMQEGEQLVFVEVRLRRHQGFGGALESVTFTKQQRIIRTADYFLLTHPAWAGHACRFDVVAMSGTRTTAITWIKDAFSTGH